MVAVNTNTEKKWRILTEVTEGPGREDMGKINRQFLGDFTPGEKLIIPRFGNGYREYPVKLSTIRMYRHEETKETVFDITGVYDLSELDIDYKGGEKIRITGYSPHSRKAKKAEIEYWGGLPTRTQ